MRFSQHGICQATDLEAGLMSRPAQHKDWHGVRYVSELRQEILEFARSKERRLRVHGEVLDLRRLGDVWFATLLDSQEREALEVSFNVLRGRLRCGAMVAVDGVLEAGYREGEQSIYYRLRGETCEVKYSVARRYREREACIAELNEHLGNSRKRFGNRPVTRFIILTGRRSKARFDVERTFRNHEERARFEFCDLRSPEDIAAKLDAVTARVQPDEAIAITRGGGGPLDLDVFDDPVVARALMRATATVPTLLAVGHAGDELLVHRIVSEVCYTPTHAARRMSWLTKSDPRRPALGSSSYEHVTSSAEERREEREPEPRELVPVDNRHSDILLWIALAALTLGLAVGWWVHEFVL